MAEGLVNTLHGDEYEAFSAGVTPSGVNHHAIRVMSEIDIDIKGHRSKGLEQFLDQEFDYVVTVCDHANENCPFFPGGKQRLHKGFMDPAAVEGSEEEKLSGFRSVRDEIKEWIEKTFKI